MLVLFFISVKRFVIDDMVMFTVYKDICLVMQTDIPKYEYAGPKFLPF